MLARIQYLVWIFPLKRITIFRRFSSKKQMKVFDRNLKVRQRNHSLTINNSDQYDYLREIAASRLVDRLDDITRTFPYALDIGCHRGHIMRNIRLKNEENEMLIGGIEHLVQCDMASHAFLSMEKEKDETTKTELLQLSNVVLDDEKLPFRPHSFDVVLSSLSLHWINDIPSHLNDVRTILKPDGAFIACMLGGTTLQELRHSFYLAETERKGGVSPHTSPLILPSDFAALMQSSGFTLPTVDIDSITVHYPDVFILLDHIRGMGENSAALNRELTVGRESFLSMAAIYQSLYGLEDGSIPATFQIISAIGWSPHESQPLPKRRGSQQHSLKDIASSTSPSLSS